MVNKNYNGSKTNKLSNEFNRVIKVALKPDALMQLKPSEVKNFFGEKSECKVCKICYDNGASFKEVKLMLNRKIRGKHKVLAILRGNKNTTLDHLNSIWTVILKNVKNVSWGYYFGKGYNNSLYLLTY